MRKLFLHALIQLFVVHVTGGANTLRDQFVVDRIRRRCHDTVLTKPRITLSPLLGLYVRLLARLGGRLPNFDLGPLLFLLPVSPVVLETAPLRFQLYKVGLDLDLPFRVTKLDSLLELVTEQLLLSIQPGFGLRLKAPIQGLLTLFNRVQLSLDGLGVLQSLLFASFRFPCLIGQLIDALLDGLAITSDLVFLRGFVGGVGIRSGNLTTLF